MTSQHSGVCGPLEAGLRGLAWVGLGANLGDPGAQLLRALRWLSAVPGIEVLATSPLRRTAPLGPPQPAYVNAVARLRTGLPPLALLDALQALERAAGRRRGVRWGPRTLDLDLLLYEDRVIRTSGLVVPHPELSARRFVLEPLADLDPTHTVPGLGRTVAELLASVVVL